MDRLFEDEATNVQDHLGDKLVSKHLRPFGSARPAAMQDLVLYCMGKDAVKFKSSFAFYTFFNTSLQANLENYFR